VAARARGRWWAPTIVTVVAIAGAHPFCNAVFRCGCGLVSLAAHCNIHQPSSPHCPWCAQPLWFAFGAALALVAAGVAIALVWRRTTALVPSLAAGLAGLVTGAGAAALITLASR
jgi:hypothetical protein